MVKPRRRPEEKRKKPRLTKMQLILPIALVAGGTGLAIGVNYLIAGPPPMEQCIENEEMPFQAITYITVTLDGAPFEVPANIGIEDGCVRPMHTHDPDGTIHTQFIKPVRFALMNFIKLWGLDIDKYDVKVFVKNPDDADFSEVEEDYGSIRLADELRIRMELTTRR
ncbi:MAG: hypothetical protein ACE5JV_03845 [Nitrososphaerales archaeon]